MSSGVPEFMAKKRSRGHPRLGAQRGARVWFSSSGKKCFDTIPGTHLKWNKSEMIEHGRSWNGGILGPWISNNFDIFKLLNGSEVDSVLITNFLTVNKSNWPLHSCVIFAFQYNIGNEVWKVNLVSRPVLTHVGNIENLVVYHWFSHIMDVTVFLIKHLIISRFHRTRNSRCSLFGPNSSNSKIFMNWRTVLTANSYITRTFGTVRTARTPNRPNRSDIANSPNSSYDYSYL